MLKTDVLKAPIPGMSLTSEPGNRPWEQPPQLNTVAEVVDFYTDRMTNPEMIGNLLKLVEKNMPLYDISKSLTTINVMKGMHSVDTGMLVQPVIIEMLKTLAELNDIGYVITREDMEKQMSIDRSVAEAAIKEVKMAGEMQMGEEEMGEEKPRGLMSRGER